MAWRLERGGAAAVIFSIALVSAASCAQVIGLEPFGSTGGGMGSGAGGASDGGGTTNEGGGSMSAGSTGGEAPCLQCTRPAMHWKGPVTLEAGNACSSGKPPVLVAALPLPTSACGGCSCVASGSCSLTITSVSTGAAECNADNSPIAGKKGCTNFDPTFPGSFIEFATAASVSPGICAIAPTCPAPAPTQFALCGLEQTCEGGACVPAGAVACVYNETMPSCPGDFPVAKPVGFADYHPACSCKSAPINAKCDPGLVTVYEMTNCATGGISTMTDTNSCASSDDRASVDYEPDEGMCPGAPELTGLPMGPVYVCCTQ